MPSRLAPRRPRNGLSLTCDRRSALEPVAVHGRAPERALLDGELGHVELRAVAQQREENAAEAMSDGDDRHLVAALRTQAGEVGMEGMARPLRMVPGFAEQRAQRRRAALGDVAVGVTVPGLVSRWHQAGIAGGVLRAREPVHV